MPAAKPVKSIEAIMANLKKKGKESTRKIYSRHGMPIERTFGVSVADLKAIAKTSKATRLSRCSFTKRASWMRCTSQEWLRTERR